MTRASGREAVRPGTVEFTKRQREVLRLLAAGKTNPEIGEALGISLDGAKWHVSEILGKLEVSTREEAAEWWQAHDRLRSRFSRALQALVPSSVWLKVGAGVAVAAGVLVAVTFGVIALRNSSGPPVVLQLSLQPDQPYTLRSAVHSIGDVTSAGQTQHADSTMTTTSAVTVGAVDADGTAHVSIAFVAIRLEINPGSPTPTVWDTAAPPSPVEAGMPTVEAWPALIGKSYTATLRPDGSVAASNADELLTSVIGQLGLSSDIVDSFLEATKNQLGDHSSDNSLQQFLPALPNGNVRTGESWTADRTTGMPTTFRVASKYTLKGHATGTATVDDQATMTTDPTQWIDIALDSGPAKMSSDQKWDLTGDLKIDLATGLVMSGQLTEKGGGTTTVIQNGQPQTETYSSAKDVTFSWQK